MHKIKILIALLMLLTTISSCQQDELINDQPMEEQGKMNVRPLTKKELQSIGIDLPNLAARGISSIGDIQLLKSTGNKLKEFSTGLYAVEISRSWHSWSTMNIRPTIMAPDGIAYAWYYHYSNEYQHIISESQAKKIGNSTSSVSMFGTIPVSGDQKLWLIFKVKSSGEYMYWY